MKRRVFIGAVMTGAITGTVGLAGCETSTREVTMELTVEAAGWSEDPGRAAETTTLPAEKGAEATVPNVSGTLTVQIVEARDDRVTVATSEKLAPRTESGGYNMANPVDRFEVHRDHGAEFSTASLDAGVTYSFNLGEG